MALENEDVDALRAIVERHGMRAVVTCLAELAADEADYNTMFDGRELTAKRWRENGELLGKTRDNLHWE